MRCALLLVALPLAACGPASEPSPTPTATATLATDAPSPVPSPSASASPNPYAPRELYPESEKTEKGARNLLLAWARAMEDRKARAAYELFGEYAERTGMGEAEYAAAFADYRTIDVAIGDGEMEGAAGSSYYQVPVTLTGTTKGGVAYRREGTITVRRVNDVDGATPAQLKWHLDRLEWQD